MAMATGCAPYCGARSPNGVFICLEARASHDPHEHVAWGAEDQPGGRWPNRSPRCEDCGTPLLDGAHVIPYPPCPLR